MEQVEINNLVPETEYYIEYVGLDKNDYLIDGKYTNVRKIGKFKQLSNIQNFGVVPYFINIRNVNTRKLTSEYPFPQPKMFLPFPPYIFYKIKSKKILASKVFEPNTNEDIGKYSQQFLGGKKSRKSKKNKTRKNKSRKNSKM